MMEKFTLFNGEKKIAVVSFSLESGENGAYVEKIHPNHPAYQPFSYKEDDFTRGDILSFLQDRCFEETRSDKKELLGELGLEEYNVVDITKKTHGRLFHDNFWILWDGEELSWEEIGRYS